MLARVLPVERPAQQNKKVDIRSEEQQLSNENQYKTGTEMPEVRENSEEGWRGWEQELTNTEDDSKTELQHLL